MQKLVFATILDAGYWILDDQLDFVYPVSSIIHFKRQRASFFQKNKKLYGTIDTIKLLPKKVCCQEFNNKLVEF